MVPDGMIKDDWTDSPDKDSDEDDANPHSTQVIYTEMDRSRSYFIHYMSDASQIHP